MSAAPFIDVHVGSELVLFGLPPFTLERLRLKLSLPNPEYAQLKRFVGFAGTTPDRLCSAVETPDGALHCPRGVWPFLRTELNKDGLVPKIVKDERVLGMPLERRAVDLAFEPRDYQREGVDLAKKHLQGLIVLPCGTGKSKLGLGMLIDQPISTLITVPTIDIARQWIEDARAMGFDPGLVGDGKDEGLRGLVVATDDSVILKIERDREWVKRFGRLICDEVHHASARTFYNTLRSIPAKYRVGLTATLDREDGLTNFVKWAFGDVLLEKTTKEMIARGFLMPCEIRLIETDFRFESDLEGPKRLAALELALSEDFARNGLIADEVSKEARSGEICLVLARSRDHVHELAACLEAKGVCALALTGKTAKKKRAAALQEFREGRLPVVVATSLADEGLDVQRCSVVALAGASRARGTTTQRVGRAVRFWKGKRPKVLDFVDALVPALANRARERQYVYREMGLMP